MTPPILAGFAAGAGPLLQRASALTRAAGIRAILSGLFGPVVFRFTGGNVRAYTVEYRSVGGRWTDPPPPNRRARRR